MNLRCTFGFHKWQERRRDRVRLGCRVPVIHYFRQCARCGRQRGL